MLTERYSQTIRNKIRKVPLNAESFIVPDETEAGRLHSSITIYDIDVTFEAKNAWLMVYNALVQPKDKPRVFHGVGESSHLSFSPLISLITD